MLSASAQQSLRSTTINTVIGAPPPSIFAVPSLNSNVSNKTTLTTTNNTNWNIFADNTIPSLPVPITAPPSGQLSLYTMTCEGAAMAAARAAAAGYHVR